MSGFFFAAGFALWTALFDRRSARWRWWLLGSVLGASTLIPWAVHVLDTSAPPTRSLANTARPEFFALWVLYPLGFPLVKSFGSDTSRLLAWPTIDGTSLHLVAVAGVVVVVAALAISVEAFARIVWPRRLPSARPFGERRSDSGLALGSAFWGFGILITLSGFVIFRHYMIVAFVLPFVAVACAALVAPRRGRALLVALIVAEAAVSGGYLSYIHVRGGARQGDYGVAYDHQSAAARHG